MKAPTLQGGRGTSYSKPALSFTMQNFARMSVLIVESDTAQNRSVAELTSELKLLREEISERSALAKSRVRVVRRM